MSLTSERRSIWAAARDLLLMWAPLTPSDAGLVTLARAGPVDSRDFDFVRAYPQPLARY
jgi:hypothetical protein